MLKRQVDDTTAQPSLTATASEKPAFTTPIPAGSTTGSHVQTTATYAQASDYRYGEGSSGNTVDTDAGASGSQSGGFTLSRGGLIAICIIVAIVALFGIVTLSLFIVAKRRQWTMRQTLKRASRRLTGRGAQRATATATDRQSRRGGMQMTAQPSRQGHKRGLVIGVNEVEKAGETKPRRAGGTWVDRLWRNDWNVETARSTR
ncbi:uncharacterized protein MYCFIDRAFT_181527 [Pseudocercospora fijiensis CIRAD86]|uniref:Uncharacterized protein n=1 Tax=Pseudocercospora fijiensis (strain CIRAD86) TaxID=383855 RepID=N1QCJ0_PSEFD|nr:uncharacterized protein MYCFIDRAFT_181527 [Pseudocercospora fijiensis CIRAD86]EME89382.1 hypothetical protein MYCFIDRAFT_181527 [Pseudocercospora fijiensis CIRAD86]